jgi:hypothetical protein
MPRNPDYLANGRQPVDSLDGLTVAAGMRRRIRGILRGFASREELALNLARLIFATTAKIDYLLALDDRQ